MRSAAHRTRRARSCRRRPSGSAVWARPAATASATRSSLSPVASASSCSDGDRPSRWPEPLAHGATRRLSSCSERGTRTAQPRSRKRCMISPSIVRAANAPQRHAAGRVVTVDGLDQARRSPSARCPRRPGRGRGSGARSPRTSPLWRSTSSLTAARCLHLRECAAMSSMSDRCVMSNAASVTPSQDDGVCTGHVRCDRRLQTSAARGAGRGRRPAG